MLNVSKLQFPQSKQLSEMPVVLMKENINGLPLFQRSPHNLLSHSFFGSQKLPFLRLNRLNYEDKAKEVQKFQNELWKWEAKQKFIEYPQFQRKFDLFKLSADHGDADSMYTVGMTYLLGYERKKNYDNIEKAIEYFTAASRQKHPQSQYCLALLFSSSVYFRSNADKAKRLMRQSSENGYSEAQYTYGLILMIEYGSYFHRKEAFNLFKTAAEKGNKKAKLLLGFSHAIGSGTKRDVGKGLEIIDSVFSKKNFPHWNDYYTFLDFLIELRRSNAKHIGNKNNNDDVNK